MARLNSRGNIIARCPDCNGRISNFIYNESGSILGVFSEEFIKNIDGNDHTWSRHYRLFKCSSCGRGGIAKIESNDAPKFYPGQTNILDWFYVESGERLQLPNNTPDTIKSEFQEAESCLEAKCYRAAAVMFRSTLEKVFEANGYKTNNLKNLKVRINKASEEGIITDARKRRAQDEIRVLGNDILHEPWKEFKEEDVVLAHKYTQRVIEDFYDMRDTVKLRLIELNRIEGVEETQTPEENKSAESTSKLEG